MPKWPETPGNEPEIKKVLYEAQVAEASTLRDEYRKGQSPPPDIPEDRAKADLELEKADWAAEYAHDLEWHKALWALATGSIERARSSAQLLQGAAVAVATAYSGLLGFIFSAGDRPLPTRALIPVIFLGLVIFFAMRYVAYIADDTPTTSIDWSGSNRENQIARTKYLILLTKNTTVHGASYMRAAVVSLLFGVLFLPAPFIATSASAAPLPPAETTEGDGAPTPPPKPSYPTPPTESFSEDATTDRELKKLLYAAQVEAFFTPEEPPAKVEVAGFRMPEPLMWIGVAVGLFIVLLAAAWKSAEQEENTSGEEWPTRFARTPR